MSAVATSVLKKFVNEPALCTLPGYRCFENEGCGYLFDATNGLLDLEPVNHCLHCRVREPFLWRE